MNIISSRGCRGRVDARFVLLVVSMYAMQESTAFLLFASPSHYYHDYFHPQRQHPLKQRHEALLLHTMDQDGRRKSTALLTKSINEEDPTNGITTVTVASTLTDSSNANHNSSDDFDTVIITTPADINQTPTNGVVAPPRTNGTANRNGSKDSSLYSSSVSASAPKNPLETVVNMFRFPPRPPETPPPAYSYLELLRESDVSQATVLQLENRLIALQRELAQKEAALQQGQEYWTRERTILTERLNEKNRQVSEQEILMEEYQSRREQLEREVTLLQGQLPAVQSMLRAERTRAEELREKLLDVEDMLEYQQMDFEKNKLELQEALNLEKERLKEIQGAFEMDKAKFVEERLTLQQQLETQLAKLEESQAELIRTQAAYQRERDFLESKLEEKRLSLETTERLLQEETGKSAADKTTLEGELSKTRIQLRKAENFLDEAQKLFTRTESELKSNLQREQKTASDLQLKLRVELETFEREKSILQTRIDQEERNIRDMEAQLRAERLEYAKDKVRLEFQLEEEIRVRRLKKKQMKNRYDQIRKEMTGLWEGAKREARQERSRLMKKYSSRIDAMRQASSTLETDLSVARTKNDEISRVLESALKERDEAIKKAADTEAHFNELVAMRNREIVGLRSHVHLLQTENEQKEHSISSLKTELDVLRNELHMKDEELGRLKGSVRRQIAQSFKLTGSRLKNAGTSFVNIFRWKK